MSDIKEAKRIVVKVGTSTLTYENGKLNLKRIDQICRVLSDLNNQGKEIVLVTSGAIGVGVGKLNVRERPTDTVKKQALAAVGQCELMFMYDKIFSDYNQVVAQLLLSNRDTFTSESKGNVQNTVNELLDMGVIPVVNENDTVDTAELEGANFGDNDMLSAIVAEIIDANALVILTDTDGLFDKDPRKNDDAQLIHFVENINEHIENIAGGTSSNRGTGGMITKVMAMKRATRKGIHGYVISGRKPKRIYDVLSGKEVGTYFKPRFI